MITYHRRDEEVPVLEEEGDVVWLIGEPGLGGRLINCTRNRQRRTKQKNSRSH
jgi:hypothetical protein